MHIYILACYPEFQYDDCFEEIYLTNENIYTQEEFENQCREAKSNDMPIIENFLKQNYGYKDLEIHAVVDTREWE